MQSIKRHAPQLARGLGGRACQAMTWVTAWTLSVLVPAIAWAQVEAPPQPALKRAPAPWIGYLAIFLLIVMVLVVSLFPSKRGHQD